MQRDIEGHQIALKQRNQNPQNNMITSFSFASTAHVTQWSNYLTQQAEILSQRSNLTPQRGKNMTLRKLKQVGFTVSSLFFQRPPSCSRQFTPNGSNFA